MEVGTISVPLQGCASRLSRRNQQQRSRHRSAMGALGNSRRGGRSPPLLIGALIAGIIVLGFNYWVSNSRNVELQTKLYELEGVARRAAADRGAVEKKKNEFEEELRRQGEQITRIEKQNRNQLEAATAVWKEEKEKLLLNISTSTEMMMTIKGQFNALSEQLGKIEKELQSCQEKEISLAKKLTEEQAQCQSEVQAVKNECATKVAAARQEAENMKKKNSSPVPAHPQTPPKPIEAKVSKGEDGEKDAEQVSQQKEQEERAAAAKAQDQPPPGNTQQQQLETNEIIVAEGAYFWAKNQTPKLKAADSDGSPALVAADAKAADKGAADPGKKAVNSTEGKEPEVLDVHGADLKTEDAGNSRVQTKSEEEGLADYKGEEENIGEPEVEKEAQLAGKAAEEQGKVPLEAEAEEPADYNGDEDNEGEFEADKQMELSEM
ncbi:Golgi membrane protein 1 isoform X1 [Arapaima gigas]